MTIFNAILSMSFRDSSQLPLAVYKLESFLKLLKGERCVYPRSNKLITEFKTYKRKHLNKQVFQKILKHKEKTTQLR